MTGPKLHTTNLTDGETVHQRCLLVTGACTVFENSEDTILVTTTGANGVEAFPEQVWPVSGGMFKALVMLSPGSNTLSVSHLHNGNFESQMDITVNYIPLLQYPPLHLVIMAASDSPLVIDCPPHKRGGISSAHSDLDAAIAKFRMTAYMWQAMTAEDFRQKGVGRRTFRLDEEWAVDTVSSEFMNAAYDQTLAREGAIRATAKVHVIRSSRTTKDIRDPARAQQAQGARKADSLHRIFEDALRDAGGPFAASAHPIVAGLILDSHFSVSQNLILGHAALGCHNPSGISLGIFGSHLTYSWPRFMEEVTQCLLDTRAPGEKVGNDNGECSTMWEACTISQGAFFHEVGHAFGSPHQPGIMERGYAQDWPKNFLHKTAYCAYLKTEGVLVTDSTPNHARWGLKDALAFRVLPHFMLPTDRALAPEIRNVAPDAVVGYESGDEEPTSFLRIHCAVGIVQVSFNGQVEEAPTMTQPVQELRFFEEELTLKFVRSQPLSLSILAYNGKQNTVSNVWKLLANSAFIVIPGSKIRLYKRSVFGEGFEEHHTEDKVYYDWAQLLKERGPDGRIYRAKSIDMRVGIHLDGGVVKYEDGHTSHWGPMRVRGRDHQFGGHASETIELPPGVDIKRVEINRGSWCMDGVRMHLTDGTVAGALNQDRSWAARLEPGSDEVIVGFYGRSSKENFTGVLEFGIITAPKEVGLDGLPDSVFDLHELRNTAGMDEEPSENGSQSGDESEEDSEAESSESEYDQ